MYSYTERVGFMQNGEDCEATVIVSGRVDSMYGADIDGNRAMPRAFIDDIEIIEVFINGEPVEDLDNIPEEIRDRIAEEVIL